MDQFIYNIYIRSTKKSIHCETVKIFIKQHLALLLPASIINNTVRPVIYIYLLFSRIHMDVSEHSTVQIAEPPTEPATDHCF